MRTPHTSAPRGARVKVVLRDGQVLYGKFKERTGKWVVLEDRKIAPRRIRVFTIVKGGQLMINLVPVYQGTTIREGALEFLYELLKERDPEINISHREMPSFEQHRQFWMRRPFRFCYLIDRPAEGREERSWIGYVSATPQNEIGIVLSNAWRGNGFGPQAIKLLMRAHQPLPAEAGVRNGHWLANIAPANAHSQHVFQALGFREIQRTYEHNEEKADGEKDGSKSG